MDAATSIWTWLIFAKPELENKILVNILSGWERTAMKNQGIYSMNWR